MKAEGYIKNYKVIKDSRQGILRVYLRYDEHATPVITGLKRVSSPGRRVYAKAKDVPLVLNGLGVNVVSNLPRADDRSPGQAGQSRRGDYVLDLVDRL